MRKRGVQTLPSPTASVTVLVVLAGFLLFVLSIPEIDRQELITNNRVSIEEIVLFSKTNIEFDGYSGLNKDVINFPDFTLDGANRMEKTLIASDFELNSNLFKTSNFEFSFIPNYDSTTIGHQITFDIDSVNGYGKIKVYLNGDEIGSFEPTEDQTLNLELPNSELIGGSNQIKISGKYIGLNPFNGLKLSLINLAILEKKQGIELEKTLMFYLPEDQIIDSAKVNFLMRNLGETMQSPIIVYLNSNEIFQINSPGSVYFSLPVSKISPEMNIIKFVIDRGSEFEVLFPKITTYTSRESAVKNYQFNIDQTEARLVTEGRASCSLNLNSDDEDAKIEVVINGFSKSIYLGDNDYEENICDNLVYGTNNIYLSSDESFDLNEIVIKLY